MKVFSLIVMFISAFLISNQNQIADQDLHRKMISEAYKKNKEFILVLKNGEKYRVSEVININDDSYQFNILQDRLSGNIFYKNNISKRSDYNYGNSSKMIMDVKSEDILMIESISYQKQMKEIRNYTFIVVGMYLIFSVFSN
tara:strand:+ start:144 stop:569 length:426 start_codon:yes stop_codon:yes gene_type:complete